MTDHEGDDPQLSLPFGNGDDDDAVKTLKEQADPDSLRGMMAGYFLEYASYVIRDRAIPHLDDGLKPVQCRILHSLHEVDDGKFHKVANIVGHVMKYHPHGDMSIYNALVHLANKEYFIDRQGNFGNILTGDGAAAARYIECRLTPLAREVLFNKEITHFVDSYDGRNKEPVTLPAKVPVLLMQGSEGIAVGMSTRILSHNFGELLQAQVAILRDEPFEILPDFLQGGRMDVSEYEEGMGKVRVRADIEIVDDKTLAVRQLPPTTTTESMMASIQDAAFKGKVKIASVTDYTAEHVEIEIKLPRGIHADTTLPALYAHTNCEVSISCNCLVIYNERPVRMTVGDVLRHNTTKLVEDLRRELELELGKLLDLHHFKTLAQIFIENRIYKAIEECTSMELIVAAIYDGFVPFQKQIQRVITDDDIADLLKIPIRRISLFDIEKNQTELREIEARMAEIRKHLASMTDFAISFLDRLYEKYAADYPRRTTIGELKQVDARKVALKNIKVGHDRKGGFIGTAVKSEEPILCTEYDKILIFKTDGTYRVLPLSEKLYVGPVSLIRKVDKAQVYCLVYRDKKTKMCYAKRFRVDRFIVDREYSCVPKGCKIEKLFDRHGVVVRAEWEATRRTKENWVEVEFDSIPIRGAQARGGRVAVKPITKVTTIKRGSDKLAPDQENSDNE